MRVAAPGEENLGQGDDRNILVARCGELGNDAGPRGQDASPLINLFETERGGAGKDKLMFGGAEGVVGGILGQSATVIGLGTEVLGCRETVQGEVLTFGTFEGVVAPVADKGQARTADTRGERKQTELRRRKVGGEAAGFHSAEIEAIDNGRGVIGAEATDLLPQIDFSFQPLRRKS